MSLVQFGFEGHTVRAFEIDGEPWFVGKDVAEVLGYSNPQKAVRDHCKAYRQVGVNAPFTPLLDAQTLIIPERDLYRLIMKSRLPSAERFEELVVGEILPAIRRTGSYNAAPALPDLSDPVILQQLLADHVSKRIEAEQRAITAEKAVEAAKPKTDFYDQYANADGLYGLQNAARVLKQNPNKFIQELKQKYLFYQGGDLVPRFQYIEMGLFEVKTTLVDDKARKRTWMTPKGIQYFARKLGTTPEAA